MTQLAQLLAAPNVDAAAQTLAGWSKAQFAAFLQEIATPPASAPVAWALQYKDHPLNETLFLDEAKARRNEVGGIRVVPLYTHPAPRGRVGDAKLTAQDRFEIQCLLGNRHDYFHCDGSVLWIEGDDGVTHSVDVRTVLEAALAWDYWRREADYWNAQHSTAMTERDVLAARVEELGAAPRGRVVVTKAMVEAAFVRLYPGFGPDDMQRHHAAEIRAALTAALALVDADAPEVDRG